MKLYYRCITIVSCVLLSHIAIFYMYERFNRKYVRIQKGRMIKEGFEQLDNLKKLGFSDSDPVFKGAQDRINFVQSELDEAEKSWSVTRWMRSRKSNYKNKLQADITSHKKSIALARQEIAYLEKIGKKETAAAQKFAKNKLNNSLKVLEQAESILARIDNGLSGDEREKVRATLALEEESIAAHQKEIQRYVAQGVSDTDKRVRQEREKIVQSISKMQYIRERANEYPYI